MTLHRYWAFGGSKYYPSGGIEDLIGMYSSIEEAKSALAENDADLKLDQWGITNSLDHWAHIIDSTNGEVVFGLLSKEMHRVRSDVDYLCRYGLDNFRHGLHRDPDERIIATYKRIYNGDDVK